MDYEKKYKEALERARKIKSEILYSHLSTESCNAVSEYIDTIIPELTESEDEKIRKEIIDYIKSGKPQMCYSKRWIAYLEKQKEIPMPNSTELIEMWHKAKAILKEKDFRGDEWRLAQNAFMDGFARGTCVKFEKQEQKPTEPSDEELQRHQDELYDFKVFAARQAREHHISFVHDFEWNNFCAELLSYFNEKQKPEVKYVYSKFRKGDVIEPITPNGSYTPVRVISINDGRYICRADDDTETLSLPLQMEDEYKIVKQKPTEWSEEDVDMLNSCISSIEEAKENRYAYKETDGDTSYDHEIDWLKDLRPQSKQEWSGEDEHRRDGVIEWLRDHQKTIDRNSNNQAYESIESLISWLKSLRPSWKPNEDQLDALLNAEGLVRANNYPENAKILASLYEQLKKL